MRRELRRRPAIEATARPRPRGARVGRPGPLAPGAGHAHPGTGRVGRATSGLLPAAPSGQTHVGRMCRRSRWLRTPVRDEVGSVPARSITTARAIVADRPRAFAPGHRVPFRFGAGHRNSTLNRPHDDRPSPTRLSAPNLCHSCGHRSFYIGGQIYSSFPQVIIDFLKHQCRSLSL